MTSFTDLSTSVADFITINHIAVDHVNDSLLLVADDSALFHSDGMYAPMLLAGNQSDQSYATGMGAAVRFDFITSFAQTNDTDILIADSNNFCVRKFERATTSVSAFIGLCQTQGDTVGSSLTARLRSITAMIWDEENDILYISDNNAGTQKLKSWNQETDMVEFVAFISGSATVQSLTMPYYSLPNYIIVILGNQIEMLHLNQSTPTRYFNSSDIAPGTVEDVVSLAPHIYAASTENKIVVFYTITNTSYVVCDGNGNNTDGTMVNCAINTPTKMAFDDDVLYIAANGKIRLLEGELSVCSRLRITKQKRYCGLQHVLLKDL